MNKLCNFGKDMKEIWKDIIDFDKYQVSNLGRVKSLERMARIGGGRFRVVKERILKQIVGSHGYAVVGMRKNNKTYAKVVHELVAISFLNHDPKNTELTVDHIIEKDKLNNRLDNLQLLTNRENVTKSRTNPTGYTGVTKIKSRYRASIKINRKSIHLGQFIHPYWAHLVYQQKLRNL